MRWRIECADNGSQRCSRKGLDGGEKGNVNTALWKWRVVHTGYLGESFQQIIGVAHKGSEGVGSFRGPSLTYPTLASLLVLIHQRSPTRQPLGRRPH